MKKVSLLLLILFSLICTNPLYAQQTDCEAIKKENEYLRKALKILTPVRSVTSSNMEFSILKMEGSIKEQLIHLTMLITNHGPNTDLGLRKSVVVDMEGTEYKSYSVNIGSGGARNKVYTDVPVKAVVEFKKVLPTAKFLKVVAVEFTGNNGGFEFKDIPVEWK